MKKVFAVVLVLFVVVGGLFAARTDISAAVGYGFEYYWDAEKYVIDHSVSFGLTAYRGFNSKWGCVVDTSFELPQKYDYNGEISTRDDYLTYVCKNTYNLGITLGPAYTLTDGRFSSYIGFGPAFKETAFIAFDYDEEGDEYDINFGIGAVLMLKYYFTDSVFASFAVDQQFTFLAYMKYQTPGFERDKGVFELNTTARLGVGVSF